MTDPIQNDLSIAQLLRPGPSQDLAVSNISTQSGELGSGTSLVRLTATVNCRAAFGLNPVATSTSLLLPAYSPEYFVVEPGTKIAALRDTVDGLLNIVEMTNDAGFDWYVDSVAGSDANDGQSSDAAFQTIGALMVVLEAGQTVGLARGSYWREMIGTISGGLPDIEVAAYGSGMMPILDCADIVGAAWTKTGGFTNLYSTAWSHDNVIGQYISLWEDGQRLRWVASQAACDAAAGTYTVATTTGATSTVYLHASGDGDPNTNGKLYEISRRAFGVRTGANWTLQNLHTRRQLHNDGSIKTGSNSTVIGCLAEDGVKHNLFLGEGCRADGCIAWKSDWPDRDNYTAFVAYTDNGTGKNARFDNCVAVLELDKTQMAVTANKGLSGFYAHTAGASGKWDQITYADCSVRGATTAFSVADCLSASLERCYCDESLQGFSPAATNSTLVDPYAKTGSTIVLRSALVATSGTCSVNGLRSIGGNGADGRGDCYIAGTAIVTVSKSVIYRAAGATYRIAINGSTAGCTLNSDHNIVLASNKGYRRKGGGTSDFNCYYPASMDFEIGAANYTDFAAYRTAQPTLDVNSIAQDPLFVNASGGNFALQPASPAASIGAGLERPDVVYKSIPSNSALEAM